MPITKSLTRPLTHRLTRAINDAGAGGGVAFDPIQVTPSVYYDPNDISTLWKDSAGTLPVTTAGDVVARMDDKSGNGYHALNTTGANRFVYAVDSDGVGYLDPPTGSEFLIVPAAAFGTSGDFDLIGVTYYKTNGNYPCFITDAGGGTGLWLGLGDGASKFFRPVNAGNVATGGSGSPVTIATATKYVVSATINQARASLHGGISNDETSSSAQMAASASWTAASGYKIGAFSGFSTDNRFYGLTAKRSLFSAAQRTSLLSYYAANAVKAAVRQTGIILGDSTIGAYLGQNGVDTYVTTTAAKQNLAIPGNTIANQQSEWLSLSRSALSRWVMIQVGLNDLDPAEAASTAIARLQSLVNIIGKRTNGAVVVSQLTPCRQRLIDLYGGTNGPIAYQKWLDINDAIAGNGATPITGVDGRVTAHVALLNDGSGNLAPAYDMDGIHENNAGRAIIGDAWQDALTALGVL